MKRKDSDIIFVIVSESSSFFHTLDEDPAAATIIYYLKNSGINNIEVFPSNNDERYVGNILNSFELFVKKHKAKFYCFSVLTSTFRIACDMIEIVRKWDSDPIIIMGGVHFNTDENIENALKDKLTDIIFKGGAEPFIEFMVSILINKKTYVYHRDGKLFINGSIPSSGIHYLSPTGIIKKSKNGLMNQPLIPVIRGYEHYNEIRGLFNDICPNNCDYCFIKDKALHRDYSHIYKKMIKTFADDIKKMDNKKLIFALSDSSPFSSNKIQQKTFQNLKEMKGISSIDGFSIFVDPSNLNMDFFKKVKELGITTFFIGRDRVVADAFIGRKLKGKLRTQEMLNMEYESIKNFISFLSTISDKGPFELFLGYILSPYESEYNSLKIINELMDITTNFHNNSCVKIQTNLFILNPYIGTKVAEKSKGEFIPLNYFYHSYPNAWISRNSINIYLELVRLLIAKVLCSSHNYGLHKVLLYLAHSLQYKKNFNFSLVKELEDSEIKKYANELVDKILSMFTEKEKNLDKYFENILELYYLGALTSIILNRKDLVKKRNDLLITIKKKDGFAPFVKKDLLLLKKLAIKGTIGYLEDYL